MKTKKAFTLIELLVVISIIALLLAILMPSLARVKEQAKRVVCMSNQHQLGIAFSTYASDTGKYPHRVQWGFWPHGGHVWWPVGAPPSTDPGPIPASFGVLFESGYLPFDEKGYRFLYCPTNKSFTYDGVFWTYQNSNSPNCTNPDWPNGLDYWRLFTAYSYWVGFPDNGPNASPRIDSAMSKLIALKVTSPGDRVVMSDITFTIPPAIPGDYSNTHMEDQGWSSHVRQGEILGNATLYNDGSVSWKKMKEILDEPEQHLWQWRGWANNDEWF